MTSGDPQTTPSNREEAKAAPVRIDADSLARFENWLDRELELLLEENSDWRTIGSNRKYFGR